MKQRTYPRWKIRKSKRVPGVVYRSLAPKGPQLWEIVYIRTELHESNPYVVLRSYSFAEVCRRCATETDGVSNATTDS